MIYLIIINLFEFIIMGIDKLQAINKKRRIPEISILSISILGGGIGGLTSMYIFNHKKNKFYFKLIFIFSIICELLLIYTYQMI